MPRLLLVPAALAALAFGCATHPVTTKTKTTQQALRGTVDLQTFPTAVTRLSAVDEAGAVTDAAVAADGTFSFSLAAGHSYRLRFSDNGALVFPRSAGSVDTAFKISAAAAAFDLGRVRYIGDPATTSYAFRATSNSAASEDDGECEDGVDENGAACIDDDDAECHEDGEHDDDDDDDDVECENGVDENGAACVDDDDDDDGEADDDGECENGVDENGAPCVDEDDDEEDDALPSEAAVPEHNPPSDLAGCGDAEEDDDDDDEDEEEDDGDDD